MTKVILRLDRIPQPDHAADALAVAITHAHVRLPAACGRWGRRASDRPHCVVRSLEADGDRVVLDVGGVGFEVGVPGHRRRRSCRTSSESRRSLFSYLHVRDDAAAALRVRSPRERSFFRLLISVTGVGPKVAVAILSAYPVDDLELAVFHADAKRFECIPGIGKKLAQRLWWSSRTASCRARRPRSAAPVARAGGAAALVAARSALLNLGHDHHRGGRGPQGRAAGLTGRGAGQARTAREG